MTPTFYSPVIRPFRGLHQRLAVLAAALVLAPAAAWAQAPANDNCSGAIALTAGTTCTTVAGTNVGATASPGVTPSNCTGGNTADVWYSVVVPAGGGVAVTTSLTAGSALDDTVLELYSGTCGSLTFITCNDDANGSTASRVIARNLTVGSTVYARVVGYDSSTGTGAFGICATVAPPPLPNDDPAGAITLPIAATCNPINGTNLDATTTTPNGYANPGAAPNNCGIARNPKDVWYKFTTDATGPGSTSVAIQVTGDAAGYLRLFSAASATGPFTEIKCASGEDFNTVSAPLVVATLTPNTTYYVSVAGFSSTDVQDAFTICARSVPANDAAVQTIYTLGRAAVSAPQVVQAVIRNEGTAALANVPVLLAVTGATTFNDGLIIPSLAVGASTTVTFRAFTPAATGNNTITVNLQSDGVNTNNTQSYPQVVSANNLSYINESQNLAGAISISDEEPGGMLATKYTINSSATIGEVKLRFPAINVPAAPTYQVVVLNANTAGLPGTAVFTSQTLTRPTTAGVVTVPVTGTTVNGTFFVAVKEVTGGMALGYQEETPLRAGTFYYMLPAEPWDDLRNTPFNLRLGIEVGFSSRVLSSNSPELAKAVSMYPNPSTGQVTLDIRGAKATGAMQVQVTNLLGQTVHTAALRDNAENKLDLSGLASGMYVVRVNSGSEYTIRQLVLSK